MILGRAAMLTDRIAAEAAQTTQMRAQDDPIGGSARRLTGMIDSLMRDAMNDALDIALAREPVDRAALAAEICEANRPRADETG